MGNSPSEFLTKANPDTTTAMSRHPEICFFGGYPTLSEVAMTYGEDTPRQWLSAHLASASAFSGARNMTVGQVTMLAEMIYTEYHYLTITEVMLFLYRWMSGRYGRQFGNVDPQSMMAALNDFITTERSEAYAAREKERQRMLREQAAKNAVPMPDYVREHLNEIKTSEKDGLLSRLIK